MALCQYLNIYLYFWRILSFTVFVVMLTVMYNQTMFSIQRCHPKDTDYPAVLAALYDPPKQLYYTGDLASSLAGPKLAIVGSRKVTPYGRQVTEKLARLAAEQGITIVSGLALGVDGIAHQAALGARGATIAVLPTGLGKIHPTTHAGLAEQIVKQGGALVTEYAPDAPPLRVNFIARNRIVAGLADAVLITEAAVKSGTMHTANFALEQGIPVLAVPGNITSEQSGGTNNLIKAGATPVTDISDILAVLKIDTTSKQQSLYGDTEEESLLLQLLVSGITDGSELLAQSALAPHVFNQSLTMLEINGKIRPLGAGHWGLA